MPLYFVEGTMNNKHENNIKIIFMFFLNSLNYEEKYIPSNEIE